MSKFSDLIQKKHEMLKVTMKVDPAACKNGEITHFQEYVGFVLAEKEFEKTYEKLLKKYTLQNEGFFDAVGGALRAVGRKLKDDIVSPFKDAKYNPFVGHGDKPVDKTESGQIISELESDWLDVNKPVTFTAAKYGLHSKTFQQLAERDAGLNKFLKQLRSSVKENYSNNKFLDLFYEATMSDEEIVTFIKSGINQTDLNRQLPIRNMEAVYIPQIEKKIQEENNKKQEVGEEAIKVKSKDVWKVLVQKVEALFKPSKSYLNDEKILWTFMLAQKGQKIILTYDPMRQPKKPS
jgi:hypothetical protein